MKTLSFKPAPRPDPTEQPDTDTPAPEEPAEHRRRRRVSQPVFRFQVRAGRPLYRFLVALAFGSGITLATAQSGTTNTAGGTTPTPQIDKPANGWTLFDEDIARDFALDDDQLTRLRAVDNRYTSDYSALGKEPMNAPTYRSLSDRRNADARNILTPDQYQRWVQRYDPGAVKPMDPPSTPTDPASPAPKAP